MGVAGSRKDRSLSRRYWWVLVLAIVGAGAIIILAVVASSEDPGSSAYQRSHLADGETEALAALLVDVPGYAYKDPSIGETENAREVLDPEVVPSLSLHTILDAAQNEVAYLQIWGFAPGVVPEVLTVDVASQLAVGEGSEVTIAGQDLIMMHDPDNPFSQYKYLWLREDVLLVADGPDEQLLTAWVESYLSALDTSSPSS